MILNKVHHFWIKPGEIKNISKNFVLASIEVDRIKGVPSGEELLNVDALKENEKYRNEGSIIIETMRPNQPLKLCSFIAGPLKVYIKGKSDAQFHVCLNGVWEK